MPIPPYSLKRIETNGGPGFQPHDPKKFTKCFRSILGTFEERPSIGISYTVHYAVFQGARSVKCLYEMMRVSIAGLWYFLMQFQGIVFLFPWSY